MNTASEILQSLADGRPEPWLGSEYMDAPRYLARAGAHVAEPPAHGSNDSDFGMERLRAAE